MNVVHGFFTKDRLLLETKQLLRYGAMVLLVLLCVVWRLPVVQGDVLPQRGNTTAMLALGLVLPFCIQTQESKLALLVPG